jgi:hypothetical protein
MVARRPGKRDRNSHRATRQAFHPIRSRGDHRLVTETSVILLLVVVTALGFDFTNGFHDTANAMATSISTHAVVKIQNSSPGWAGPASTGTATAANLTASSAR